MTEPVTLYVGDCIDVMRTLPDASIDAVCTDPPYDLTANKKGGSGAASINLNSPGGRSRISTGNGGGGFMGKGWDSTGIAFDPATWREVLRVLKPGGHLLAFGGARTWHRLTVAIEDAGFEIRDSIAWLYGSGFPKSLDVSRAIDKAAGAEREVIGYDASKARPNKENFAKRTDRQPTSAAAVGWKDNGATVTAPATEDARTWQGWGSALKPGFEPIVVARKPLIGTIAVNVLTHGTGALNIDATRVAFNGAADEAESKQKNRHADYGTPSGGNAVYGDYTMVPRINYDPSGRWPTNVLLDESQAVELDKQGGNRTGGHHPRTRGKGGLSTSGHSGQDDLDERHDTAVGGASRFFPTFRYQAKAPQSERPKIFLPSCDCEDPWPTGTSTKKVGQATGGADPATSREWSATSVCGNCGAEPRHSSHVTVKPLALIRWLVRLVTPPGGVVLDPFLGSGTTAQACEAEGFRCIGIESDETYVPMTAVRLGRDVPTVRTTTTTRTFDDVLDELCPSGMRFG